MMNSDLYGRNSSTGRCVDKSTDKPTSSIHTNARQVARATLNNAQLTLTRCALFSVILLWGIQTITFSHKSTTANYPVLSKYEESIDRLTAKAMEKVQEVSLKAGQAALALDLASKVISGSSKNKSVPNVQQVRVDSNCSHANVGLKPTVVQQVLQKVTGEEKNFETPLEEDFIYVYDIGIEQNLQLAKTPVRWWAKQYEGEYELFDMLAMQKHSVTRDPERATLFYIPFFSARFTLLKHSEDTPYMMEKAINETSAKWNEILHYIKTKFPYFNRHNGRDHFSALTMDHGRCNALIFCDPTVYKEMFFLQINADKNVRSRHMSTKRGVLALTYNYNARPISNLPDIPCYMPDRDIAVPPVSTITKITKPWESDRPITMLFRFAAGQHHGVSIPYFNHYVRQELLDMYSPKKYPDWSIEVKSEWVTRKEWKHAKFCMCPPGHSQWTSRPMKSILSGCIPVTMFRDHDNPWQDEMDYESFSINIDIEQIANLKQVIDNVMNTPGKLEQMQRELAKIQESYLWGYKHPNGARGYVMKALKQRAEALTKWKRRRNISRRTDIHNLIA